MYNNRENIINLSTLGHTWILDLDGTIVKHNGYKIDGQDTLLDGALEFLKNISENIRDIVREEETLSIKMQVHDDIGRGMIMARQLLAKGADAKEIRQNCSQMEMTVDYLNYMNQTEQKNNDLKQLCDRAAMMGVQLHVEGTLPTKEIARTIFLNAIRE